VEILRQSTPLRRKQRVTAMSGLRANGIIPTDRRHIKVQAGGNQIVRAGGLRILQGGIQNHAGRKLMGNIIILNLRAILIIMDIVMVTGLTQVVPGMKITMAGIGVRTVAAGGMRILRAGIQLIKVYG
jgi:hypothetical protein